MKTELKLRKAHMDVMDKIMEADVNGAILKQPRVAFLPSSEALTELILAGMVERGTEVRDGVMITEGYQFTLLGHLNYCMLCEDVDDED